MSRLGNLIPLLILFVVVGGGAYVGYQIYLWSNEMSNRGKKHMEKKNMSFTKEGGLKVGVKQMRGEAYEDKTQHALVNMWNTSSEARKTNATSRPTTSRSSSSQAAGGDTAAATRPTPSPRPSATSRASSNSIPGGW